MTGLVLEAVVVGLEEAGAYLVRACTGVLIAAGIMDEEENIPVEESIAENSEKTISGFIYQGKANDMILNEPMVVSSETHADFWEDDMDYSETVSTENTKTQTSAQTETDERKCKSCPPEGKVMPMVRRCSRWSMVTISYQTRICGTFYNPETKQIEEFKYCSVSFDGWKAKLCQFWEAKARYDQFLISSRQKKHWWKGDRSAVSQAVRHQTVATINQPLKVVWFFMQPVSFVYFQQMFTGLKDIIVRYQS
ncbi:Tox-REase-5 domain-containing protein [Cronobacter sakazakii]|nr:hypothetical protein [Cronobacter sakazakii]